MMSVLIYANTGLTSKQIGLTGQLVKDLESQDFEVDVVMCDNVLNNCYFNRSHNLLGCASCQARMSFVLQSIGEKNRNFINLKNLVNPLFGEITSTEELLKIEYQGFNVGRGVASSIISYMRDFELSSEKFGELISLELSKAANIVENFQEILKKDYDAVYIFNGRISEAHPVVEICRDRGVSFYTVEAGSGTNYELFEGDLPHSIVARNDGMNRLWEETQQNVEIAHSWFRRKRQGSKTVAISYLDDQIKGHLPGNWDSSKFNILILNSSEDEMKALAEWKTHLYNSQNEAIRQIVRGFASNPNYVFYLRVHPNLGKVKNNQIIEIEEFDFPNLHVIPPESSIDTYALIESCDKSIAFGSTTGIEAAYWGTPSILYGNALYRDQGCTYNPQTFEELVSLILNKELQPIPQEKCLPYAYYMSTFGHKSNDFSFGGLENSFFQGRKLRRFPLSAFRYLWRYRTSLSLWKMMHKAVFQKTLSLVDIFKYK